MEEIGRIALCSRVSGLVIKENIPPTNCSSLSAAKYQCAQKWKIRCISIEWIKDSVAKGYCQDENNYLVEGGENGGTTSTPERQKGGGMV